jgi:hypothetical protein
MLVTLATNETIGSGASATYTYSPTSLQSVQVRLGDPDWELGNITVQLGSVTICNGASNWGLAGLTGLYSNVKVDAGSDEAFINLNFGSHQCTDRDNLYVTVTAGASAISAVDVSAVVDKPGQLPLRITEYSDNTFVSPSNLMGISFDSAFQNVENDDYRCEIRTPVSSSSPSFVSASSYYRACAMHDDSALFGLLNKHDVPLETSYNYSSSAVTDRIITVEQMPSSAQEIAQSETQAKIIASQKS